MQYDNAGSFKNNSVCHAVASSTEDRDVMVNCLQLGAADYMMKPLRLTELRNLWARVYWWRRVSPMRQTYEGLFSSEFGQWSIWTAILSMDLDVLLSILASAAFAWHRCNEFVMLCRPHICRSYHQ